MEAGAETRAEGRDAAVDGKGAGSTVRARTGSTATCTAVELEGTGAWKGADRGSGLRLPGEGTFTITATNPTNAATDAPHASRGPQSNQP